MTYDIIPLFSKVFYKNQLDVDVKKYVSLIENKFENSGTNSPTDVDNIALTSSSRFVLDAQKFVDLKNIIMKEFPWLLYAVVDMGFCGHMYNNIDIFPYFFSNSHSNRKSYVNRKYLYPGIC